MGIAAIFWIFNAFYIKYPIMLFSCHTTFNKTSRPRTRETPPSTQGGCQDLLEGGQAPRREGQQPEARTATIASRGW